MFLSWPAYYYWLSKFTHTCVLHRELLTTHLLFSSIIAFYLPLSLSESRIRKCTWFSLWSPTTHIRRIGSSFFILVYRSAGRPFSSIRSHEMCPLSINSYIWSVCALDSSKSDLRTVYLSILIVCLRSFDFFVPLLFASFSVTTNRICFGVPAGHIQEQLTSGEFKSTFCGINYLHICCHSIYLFSSSVDFISRMQSLSWKSSLLGRYQVRFVNGFTLIPLRQPSFALIRIIFAQIYRFSSARISALLIPVLCKRTVLLYFWPGLE